MRPARILHLTPPGFGGIDTYIFNHYRYMDQNRFCFEFLTQNTALEKAEQYRDFFYKVWPMPATAAQNRDGFVKNIREIFQNGFDVLHLHTSYWTGFLLEELAMEAGIRKVIVHSHSSFIEETNPEKRQMLLARHKEVKRSFSRDLATDFWACSTKAADWLFGPQIPRGQIRIMKNAIEVERFRFNSQKRKQIRTELGLQDNFVLGTVGRLTFPKNQEFLIDLLFELRKTCQKAKLVIVGDGELRQALERQIYERGLKDAVLLLGWKRNVEDYLSAMDMFLLPSRFEGDPISLVEAVASGLPAVIADTITEDAIRAETVQRAPVNIARWISAITHLAGADSNREDGVEAARDAGYDVKQQAKVLEEMYQGEGEFIQQ